MPLQVGKIELRVGSDKTPPQIEPGIAVSGRSFCLPHQVAERAGLHLLIIFVAPLELRGLYGVEWRHQL
jgi:hypothetical protein